jgi:hypothetical protein
MIFLVGEGKYDDRFFYQMMDEIKTEHERDFKIKHGIDDFSDLLKCTSQNSDKNMYYRCFLWGGSW